MRSVCLPRHPAVAYLFLVRCNDAHSTKLALEAAILVRAHHDRSTVRLVDAPAYHVRSWSSSSRIHRGISDPIRPFFYRACFAVVFVHSRLASSSLQMTPLHLTKRCSQPLARRTASLSDD